MELGFPLQRSIRRDAPEPIHNAIEGKAKQVLAGQSKVRALASPVAAVQIRYPSAREIRVTAVGTAARCAIRIAPARAWATEDLRVLLKGCRGRYAKALGTLIDDRQASLAFHELSAEQRMHLRSTKFRGGRPVHDDSPQRYELAACFQYTYRL